ncbi:hypothetical protein X275_00660 [Marinitoga sp. 1197]|uniref:lipopolysaccharide biosynthesis protein n=1 Tax=Marinitoga sp. 1197 TaxID=1428449 RepID=UPI000640CA5D|nr:oligosaccharide flippase family protein [Marinitoga sp. 1197]KLO24342.1 hypothetical protein X275_00660 [Marinitoga sp. 1197]
MENEAKDFLKKLFGFSIGPVFSAILGFISAPIISWLIVPAEFGKVSMYTLAFEILSIIAISGFDQAFIREYNKFKNKLNYLFLNVLVVPMIFSIMISILLFLLNNQISYFLFDSSEKMIIVILSFSLIFRTIENFNLSLIRMQEKAKIYSFFSIFNKLINLPVLILLLLYVEKTFRMVIIADFISIILRCILLLTVNKEYFKFNFKDLDKNFIKELFNFGVPFVPAALLSWLFNSLDKTFLRIYTNFNEIGLYSVAFKFVVVLNLIKASFTTFWVPVSYRWYENGYSKEKFYKVSMYILSIMMLIISILIYFRFIIVKILAPIYYDSAQIFPFLLLIPFMITISETTVMGINFKKKTKYHFWISLITLIVNFIGNYFLVKYYGAIGASISTGLSYVVFFWLRTYFSMKIWYKFEISRYAVNIAIILSYDFYILSNHSYLIESIFLIVIIAYNFKMYLELKGKII